MAKVVLVVVAAVVVVAVGFGVWLALSIENHGVDPDVTVTIGHPRAEAEEGDLVRFQLRSDLPSGDDWQWHLPKGLHLSSYADGNGPTHPPWVEVVVEEAGDYAVPFERCPGSSPCEAKDAQERVTFHLRAA